MTNVQLLYEISGGEKIIERVAHCIVHTYTVASHSLPAFVTFSMIIRLLHGRRSQEQLSGMDEFQQGFINKRFEVLSNSIQMLVGYASTVLIQPVNIQNERSCRSASSEASILHGKCEKEIGDAQRLNRTSYDGQVGEIVIFIIERIREVRRTVEVKESCPSTHMSNCLSLT